MAFSSDAVYLAVSEQPDNYPYQVIALLACSLCDWIL
jgi:hypothetical protein